MKRFLLMAGVFVSGLAAAGLAVAVMMAPTWIREWNLRQQKPELETAVTVTEEEQPSEEDIEQAQREKFADLLAQNPDVVGWITIPDTPIDLPVMQTTDNEFYLRHGLDKEYDNLGLPFVDYECDLKNSRNLIIYGHNMGVDDTDRFSSLQEYRDTSYYAKHPVIQLDTLYGSQTYKVIAVFAVTARTSDEDFFQFNKYVDFEDDAAEQEYLDAVEERAFYTTGDYARADEHLLTLCTCTYEMDDARLVVMARPLREGESTEADSVTVNPDPLLPARWPSGA